MENQPLEPPSNLEEENIIIDKPGKPKLMLYGLLIVILITAIAGGAFYAKKHSRIIDQANLDLPEDGRQALEAQITALQAQAESLAGDAKREDRFQVYYKLAEAKYLLGRYAEAVKDLDGVAADNQDNASMHSLYASVYRDMRDLKNAKESAKRAIDLDSKNPQAWVMHISLREDAGQDALKSFYQEALDKTANNVGIVTAYAQFLEKIGDREGAIAQWQKAAEVFPQGKATYDGEIARLLQSSQ